eukprot:11158185-Lingulodinium_polyedra.AAC.1
MRTRFERERGSTASAFETRSHANACVSQRVRMRTRFERERGSTAFAFEPRARANAFCERGSNANAV